MLDKQEIISGCCDEIAVMNYYKSKEKEHIETEVALADKYKKQLINIFELQEPGDNDLTEKNTYYHDGLKAVADSFMKLRDNFPNSNILMSLHDAESLKEVYFNE